MSKIFKVIETNNVSQLQTLIQEGADLNVQGFLSYTLLMTAITNNATECIHLLLAHKVDLEAKSFFEATALLLSCEKLEYVQLLLDAGANPNTCQGKWSPLMRTARGGQLKIAELLLKYGADPWLLSEYGETAETIARYMGHHELADLIRSYSYAITKSARKFQV